MKLHVGPSGTKVWAAYRFYWKRRRQLLQLGTWPQTNIATARERTIGARKVLRELLYKLGGTEDTHERSFDHDELKAFLLNYKQACRTRRIAHVLACSS